MKIIVIKTQNELDALPASFTEWTKIEIRSTEKIYIKQAWGNSSVVARENSSVEAWGNSSVVAWGNSSVVAQDFSMIAVLSSTVVIKKLLDWSVASLRGVKVKIVKKHKTATVIKTPESIVFTKKSFVDRCEKNDKESIILYKSVNPQTKCDFQTGTIKYEGKVNCPDWDPNPERECGGGLHLSPTKGAALSYHKGKLLKCKVKLKDFVVYSGNGTKVRCKQVEVLGDA